MILHVGEREWRLLRRHMAGERERAAFLLAHRRRGTLTVFDLRCLDDGEVDSSGLHLILPDRLRGEMIGWAWRSRACLIESHSHPHGDPAAFSLTDLVGLSDWVPHARWRLAGTPYIALVHAPESFDALTFTAANHAAGALTELLVGTRRLTPTGLTRRYLCERAL